MSDPVYKKKESGITLFSLEMIILKLDETNFVKINFAQPLEFATVKKGSRVISTAEKES